MTEAGGGRSQRHCNDPHLAINPVFKLTWCNVTNLGSGQEMKVKMKGIS